MQTSSRLQDGTTWHATHCMQHHKDSAAIAPAKNARAAGHTEARRVSTAQYNINAQVTWHPAAALLVTSVCTVCLTGCGFTSHIISATNTPVIAMPPHATHDTCMCCKQAGYQPTRAEGRPGTAPSWAEGPLQVESWCCQHVLCRRAPALCCSHPHTDTTRGGGGGGTGHMDSSTHKPAIALCAQTALCAS